jgi:hypothetical protein
MGMEKKYFLRALLAVFSIRVAFPRKPHQVEDACGATSGQRNQHQQEQRTVDFEGHS